MFLNPYRSSSSARYLNPFLPILPLLDHSIHSVTHVRVTVVWIQCHAHKELASTII